MLLVYNKKIEVVFSKEDKHALDGQSRILNWLYNQLLTICQDDYKENGNVHQFLKNDNLRNYVTNVLKVKHPFLRTVHSSPVKEVSNRLKDAYERLFSGQNEYPNYRSWKKKWYSLFFDEPNKGWEVEGDKLLIMLGKIPHMPKIKGKQNPGVYGILQEKLELGEDEQIKNFRLCKQQGDKYYAIFNIERGAIKYAEQKEILKQHKKEIEQYKYLKKQAKTKEEKRKLPFKPIEPNFKKLIPEKARWIALDPNHKNFFVGVDYKGNSIEWKKLSLIKYWDNKIDKLKAKRDICEKKYRVKKTKNGSKYTVHSPRWNKINKALNKAYHCRREQIKATNYTIAHLLYNHYDVVLIGDYTPSNGTAPFKNMKRSMLNQEVIGQFRRILKWVADKKDKHYFMVNEYNTTKDCCVCGHQEKKTPDIREFTCINCGTKMMRDNNSGVNIGKKEGFVLNPKYVAKLEKFTFKAYVPIGKKAMIQTVKELKFV